MTVKELIEKLKEFNEDYEVEVSIGSGWELYGKTANKVYEDDFDKIVHIE